MDGRQFGDEPLGTVERNHRHGIESFETQFDEHFGHVFHSTFVIPKREEGQTKATKPALPQNLRKSNCLPVAFKVLVHHSRMVWVVPGCALQQTWNGNWLVRAHTVFAQNDLGASLPSRCDSRVSVLDLIWPFLRVVRHHSADESRKILKPRIEVDELLGYNN
jgi:hypothetical protein